MDDEGERIYFCCQKTYFINKSFLQNSGRLETELPYRFDIETSQEYVMLLVSGKKAKSPCFKDMAYLDLAMRLLNQGPEQKLETTDPGLR